MPIETWFPTVIFHEDLDVPTPVRAQALERVRQLVDEEVLEQLGRYTAANGPNTLHLDPPLRPLLKILGAAIRRFLFDELRLDRERVQFYLGRCWPVVQSGSVGGELHTHAGAAVSGVFYLETPEGSGGLAFQQPFALAYSHLARSADTPLTYDRVVYEAARHRLFLFASNVPHAALRARCE